MKGGAGRVGKAKNIKKMQQAAKIALMRIK